MKILSIAPLGSGIGVTSSLMALSLLDALDNSQKTLVIPLVEEQIPIENLIDSQIWRSMQNVSQSGFNDIGMDALLRKLRSSQGQVLEVGSAVVSVGMDMWNLLPSTRAQSEEWDVKYQKELFHVIQNANIQYDKVWIDASHVDLELQLYYMKLCDCVLIHLPQNMNYLKNLFSNTDLVSILKSIKPIFLISGYHKNSKYNCTNIRRSFQLSRDQMGVIPWLLEYTDALSEGQVYSLIKKTLRSKKNDYDYYFINEIRSSLDYINQAGGS